MLGCGNIRTYARFRGGAWHGIMFGVLRHLSRESASVRQTRNIVLALAAIATLENAPGRVFPVY